MECCKTLYELAEKCEYIDCVNMPFLHDTAAKDEVKLKSCRNIIPYDVENFSCEMYLMTDQSAHEAINIIHWIISPCYHNGYDQETVFLFRWQVQSAQTNVKMSLTLKIYSLIKNRHISSILQLLVLYIYR